VTADPQHAATFVHAAAVIDAGVTIGEGSRVWAGAHLREGASLGAECRVGEGVFIDTGVVIGARCKIENGALIFHGVRLEDDVFIGPGAILTNDRLPRASTPDGVLKGRDDWTVTATTVARGASVGAAAVVVAGNDVGAWALVGAGAVVTGPVPAHALVAGNPARQLGWVCRCALRLDDALRCTGCGRAYATTAAGLQPAPAT
jgi:UDP-2-acetamido-3-amino-2,3-dideoxy-glucuronate N-acetyltransferase